MILIPNTNASNSTLLTHIKCDRRDASGTQLAVHRIDARVASRDGPRVARAGRWRCGSEDAAREVRGERGVDLPRVGQVEVGHEVHKLGQRLGESRVGGLRKRRVRLTGGRGEVAA